jgi:hypothetical protein
MRPSRWIPCLLALVLVACQAQPVLVTPTSTLAPANPSATRPAETPIPSTATPTSTSLPTSLPPTQTPAAPIDFLAGAGKAFTSAALKTFQPGTYAVKLDALPIHLGQLGNPAVIGGLTAQQKDFLSKNGFVVMQAGDQQFKDLRRTVSSQAGQPYYLTTDAAYHALHVNFDDLLAALETEYLRPVLGHLIDAENASMGDYMALLAGQPLQKDAQLSQAYLAVASKLLYPDIAFNAPIEARIAPQIAQIMAYGGRQASLLIPNLEDDYGAYRPVGHYAGVPALEDYFRCMTWLGRVAFKFKDPDVPGLVPSRAPLLMTLALREAQIEGEPAYQVWSELNAIMDFMVGPSDDPGPAELNALMEQVYGRGVSLSDIQDETKWQTFLGKVDRLAAPKINSTFASFSATQAASRDWRLMGQRFTLDGFIFQSLIYDKVGTEQKPRNLPSGLDVAAAFGSAPALTALKAVGETQYAHYTEQMSAVQKMVNQQPEEQWLNRFYSAWLYAFLPQVAPKDNTAFPPFMRTAAYGYKEMNALLGSWAELKHDTVLYAKSPEPGGGGGPPTTPAAPAYVEPNPNVFYRLAYAANALYQGLTPLITAWDEKGWANSLPSSDYRSLRFISHYYHLQDLVKSFQAFGAIAERELQGQALTSDDFDAIQVCLEVKECMDRGHGDAPIMDPVPVVAAVSGWKDSVLEAAVGNLNRIYVAVPLEGKLEIAQGGVFSYYEFTQPRSERLTDQAWVEKLAKNPPAAPAWMSQFVLPGGKTNNPLVFRIGDIYKLTEKGLNPPLNLRAGPGTTQAVLKQLDQEYTYLTLVDGPVKNSEGAWWKVELFYDQGKQTGWVLENPDWFERAIGQ